MSRYKTLGGIFIIAGTSIGAGMLALPLVTAGIGFLLSVGLILMVWGLANYSGLLLAEACCICPDAKTLHEVSGKMLGRFGQFIATVAMLVLFYSLSAAYIAEGAVYFRDAMYQSYFALSTGQASLLVTLLIGGIVYAGVGILDKVNRLLFVAMCLALLMVFIGLLPNSKGVYLFSNEDISFFGVMSALPVIYTSFGYHGSLPTVIHYLSGKPESFRIAIMCGTVIPLLVYTMWQLAVFGNLPVVSSLGTVDVLVQSLQETSRLAWFSVVINYFTILALATSFLGVLLGLFEYLLELFGCMNNQKGRFYVLLITLLPPLFLAVYVQKSFVLILGYAAVGLVVLAIYLPVCIVWKARSNRQSGYLGYQVPGGKLGMIIASFLGSVIVLSQIGVTLF